MMFPMSQQLLKGLRATLTQNITNATSLLVRVIYVYSFGVVLMELISSLPAVDMFRQRHEINLANLAIDKIEKCAFHELIDPHLGFESDNGIKTTAILVAQLAFQCLQPDKEMRPSMDEQPGSSDCDEVGFSKTQSPPPSLEVVTDNWTSRSTTPNVSG
uniref:Serine-threonine/tyrosine-protein kinase catalytic domain-containing protein n=1 Tax=Fagus sylvatica TaxID=28930 RepID=A0A2N9JAN3_FAGSY